MSDANLRPARTEELEQALAHALLFDGKRAFKISGEMMARLTAAHLATSLQRAGFLVMKAPDAALHSDRAHYDAQPEPNLGQQPDNIARP